MSLIELNGVTKEFKIFIHPKGIMRSIKSFFYREYEIKKAIDDIGFTIEKGELVGYIGPNGAGKSTTIKILSGILTPTSGTVTADGRVPYKNRKENAMHIGVVFGQRSQLFWDLPVEETFDLYKKMYKVDEKRFKRNVRLYVELLGMEEFINRPVRVLSLGQKMRANLAVALLHDPEILYLDEPTIGLDVVAKNRMRHFIREINKEKRTTVIITTHDMNDIETICNRIIMIDKGRLLYDGGLADFKNSFGTQSLLEVEFADKTTEFSDNRLRIIKTEGNRKWIVFNKNEICAAEAVTMITRKYDIIDLVVKEPDVEEIVRNIYEKGSDKILLKI